MTFEKRIALAKHISDAEFQGLSQRKKNSLLAAVTEKCILLEKFGVFKGVCLGGHKVAPFYRQLEHRLEKML